MNERDIFIAALDKATAEERSDYVTAACGGDSQLRQRVEALLQTHEQSGEFLQKPLVERLAEGVDDLEEAAETAHEPAWRKSGEALGFLKPSDQPGSLGRLGHYEVQEVIGSGGMGIVLRAFDERLHRVVAIKVMAAPLATNVGARKRFQREARAAAAVCHDHIVTIHAVEQWDDLPCLVMQCVAGLSLQQRLDRDGPLALHEILRIGMQTAAGLAAAHAQGLIHRDIKPANILLENGVERVKITDFGLARAVADASVSQTGIAAGTPQYMSPEQARGDALDCRTDLFSLGSVLYAMCTGRAPFRATHSMAVLKRVCEDTPSPIREANSDVPDWLIATIDKLLAKNPADRYQSAAEVAELLGQRLAQLQHSTPLPLATPKPVPAQPAAQRWPMWAVAALVLLLFGVSLTEATGVTKFAPVLMRIVTGEGTLLVEVNDPAVKVTVEGDGGLIITGAGLHEVHLKPGKYQLKADKNGQRVPLTQELVTITRGNDVVVRVRREAAVAAVPPARTSAFVLLGGKGIAERKFDALADAASNASDGDTIEVRGNGPFITEPINLGRTALTIRAGAGFRPVIKASRAGDQKFTALLQSDGRLVLEGLEIQRTGAAPKNDADPHVIVACGNGPLHAVNCRFVGAQLQDLVSSSSTLCELRNCEFLGRDMWTVLWAAPRDSRLVITNCLHTSHIYLANDLATDLAEGKRLASIQLTNNTVVAPTLLEVLVEQGKGQPPLKAAGANKDLQVEAAGNVLVTGSALGVYVAGNDVPDAEVESFLAKGVGWKGERNLFSLSGPFLYRSESGKALGSTKPLISLADWKEFWGSAETGSVTGKVKYHGGDLHARLAAAPDTLTPADFRLRPDSAGYRAGPDGKDLGADVDLVGPGAAYERWKKTPEYQTWLKDTGQRRTEAPKSESGAFVVLGGKGVAERKFDALADAASNASDGDTVEIRGNGPFVTQSIDLGRQGLTIRAAAGYWPVITGNATSRRDGVPYLLYTRGPLVLEGVELRMTGRDPARTVYSEAAPLSVANCRFVQDGSISIGTDTPVLTVRNTEFVCRRNDESNQVYWDQPSNGTMTLENNLWLVPAGYALSLVWLRPDLHDVSVRLSHNTVVAGVSLGHGLHVVPKSAGLDAAPNPQPVRVHLSENLFNTTGLPEATFSLLLPYWVNADAKPLPAEEAERLLPRLMAWREERNLYRRGMIFQMMARVTDRTKPDRGEVTEVLPAGRTLADWQRLWKSGDSGSAEGVIKYEGGNLIAKMQAAPERVTPADFRLRPDSAGFRAGKDGKDLGADVDLVGPGEAYERWKKTPEYEEWLKETGQQK